MDQKCLALKIGKPLWKAISVAAMEGETTLAGVVVPVLEKAFSESPKPPTASVKRVVVASESVGVGKELEPGEVLTRKCTKCGDVFPIPELTAEPRTGKLFCAGCVDNMRNSQ